MKLQVTMKDPDTLIDALNDKKHDLAKMLMAEKGLTKAGAEAEAEALMERMEEFVSAFFEWGEYLTVVFDDEAKTATVMRK